MSHAPSPIINVYGQATHCGNCGYDCWTKGENIDAMFEHLDAQEQALKECKKTDQHNKHIVSSGGLDLCFNCGVSG